MRPFATVLVLLLTPLILASPIEVRESEPTWPQRFALLDRDGCYKLKRDLGIELVNAHPNLPTIHGLRNTSVRP